MFRIFSTLVLFLTFVFSSFAQFNQNQYPVPGDSVGIPVHTSLNIQLFNKIVGCSDGGWYYLWTTTNRNAKSLYLSKIGWNGDSLWSATVYSSDYFVYPNDIETLTDGVAIGWQVEDSLRGRIAYVQKFGNTGQIAWSQPYSHLLNLNRYDGPRLFSDSSGGCYSYFSNAVITR